MSNSYYIIIILRMLTYMQRLTWLEIVFGVIPENLIFIFGIYVFSNTIICRKKLLLSALLVSLSTYLVKLLPLQFGIHMFIFIMVFIAISAFMNHIDIIKAVTSVLLLFIIRLITEWISIFALEKLSNISVETLADNPLEKVLYALPSLFIFFMVVLIVYILKHNKQKKRID